MNTVQHRIDTLTRFIEEHATEKTSTESAAEQLDLLLFIGNVLGLDQAVGLVRRRIAEQESPAAKFERLNSACNQAAEELSAHFLPRVHALLEKGDVEEAEQLVRQIPSESVTKVFALDALRQAKLKKET